MPRGKGNKPLPGSKVEKIIETMRAQPERVIWSSADVAAIIDMPCYALANMLRAAVANGWIYRDNSKPRNTEYSLQPFPEPEVEVEPFSCNLHGDGDLDLHGLLELESGGWRVPRENVVTLRKLLTGELLA